MSISWEAIGAAVMALLAGIGAAWRRAMWPVSAMKKRRQETDDAHAQISEVVDKVDQLQMSVDRIERRVEHMETTVDDGFTNIEGTVAYLHRHDLKDDPLARERLDVERDDDFLRNKM